MWIEVFKAGKHTDAHGITKDYSTKDLDAIVSKYDPKVHEAPVCIGHPKDNAPAYGWVESLKRTGDVLQAKLHQLAPEFVEMVKAGRFKKRSISLYPDSSFRHLALLGAMPPAVKVLADISFTENDGSVCYEFSEFSDYRFSIISDLARKIREFIINKFDIETADKVVNDWDIEQLKQEPVKPDEISGFTENNFKEEEEMDNKIKEYEEQITAFKEQEKTRLSELESLKNEVSSLKAQSKKAEYESFCDELIKDGKLTPSQKNQTLYFMEVMDNSGEMQFSEQEKKPYLSAFKEFLKSMPKQVEFSEIARKDNAGNKIANSNLDVSEFSENVDTERLAIHEKALNLSFAEKIPYEVAVNRIIKEGK